MESATHHAKWYTSPGRPYNLWVVFCHETNSLESILDDVLVCYIAVSNSKIDHRRCLICSESFPIRLPKHDMANFNREISRLLDRANVDHGQFTVQPWPSRVGWKESAKA